MNKIILAIGDSGSCANLIRNLITLSRNVHWPHSQLPRLEFIIETAYPKNIELNSWLKHEYKLRNWKKVYDIDVSHEPDSTILTPKVITYLKNFNIVFLVHWILDAKKILSETTANVITISPKSEFGLFWQIRAFVEKCGIDNVPNYSFESDILESKKKFIDEYGIDLYRKTNVLNMYEIIQKRVKTYRQFGVQHGLSLDLEDLFYEKNFIELIKKINNFCNLDICLTEASIMRNRWWSLHWQLEKTKNFIWL